MNATEKEEILESLNRLKRQLEAAVDIVESGRMVDSGSADARMWDFVVGDFKIVDMKRFYNRMPPFEVKLPLKHPAFP